MKKISIVIPAYNEEKNITLIFNELVNVFDALKDKYESELIFVNDGSTDKTSEEIEKIVNENDKVKFIQFSRNFGKEIATTAGLNNCNGDACIMLDADMQHPVEIIPAMLEKWEAGAEVVVGIRKSNEGASWFKKTCSMLFYQAINKIAETKIVPNSTDFRLLDRMVIDEFNRLQESGRMTRALIDWLGFKREFIYFDARERLYGSANYSFWKLLKLAINSFVSLSLVPLKLAGTLGLLITFLAGSLGFVVLVGKFLRTAYAANFSAAENLAILTLFLVGILLVSIGLIALYIANIHREVINRPMYIIRKKNF